MTTTTYTTIDPTEVQFFLDNIGGREFTVIFLKKDGTQRKITGMLDTTKTNRSNVVPVMETDTGAWKSFDISRVLYIDIA